MKFTIEIEGTKIEAEGETTFTTDSGESVTVSPSMGGEAGEAGAVSEKEAILLTVCALEGTFAIKEGGQTKVVSQNILTRLSLGTDLYYAAIESDLFVVNTGNTYPGVYALWPAIKDFRASEAVVQAKKGMDLNYEEVNDEDIVSEVPDEAPTLLEKSITERLGEGL